MGRFVAKEETGISKLSWRRPLSDVAMIGKGWDVSVDGSECGQLISLSGPTMGGLYPLISNVTSFRMFTRWPTMTVLVVF